MPSPNVIKQFAENAYYHVYNRGVEKKRIFDDREDYETFLRYLQTYLTPHDQLIKPGRRQIRWNLLKGNLADEVSLLAFCLMPNHFHMLLHQKTKDGISKLMKQISTAYSMYYNKRYDRVGHLFQGIYKGIVVENDEYLLHLSRYIHLNPLERGVNLRDFPWSSYYYYASGENSVWVDTKTIKNYFDENNPNLTYSSFVEDSVWSDLENIEGLTLE